MAIIDLQEKSLPATCLVYKHSTRCPISAAAAKEVQGLESNLPIYWINVIEQRMLSNWVAEQFAVAHQSPQLILIEQGKAVKKWSHGEIRRSRLAGDLAEHLP